MFTSIEFLALNPPSYAMRPGVLAAKAHPVLVPPSTNCHGQFTRLIILINYMTEGARGPTKEMHMKTIHKMAASSAIAVAAFAFVAMTGSGAAASEKPDQAYCLGDGDFGSAWCGFATYAQCQATASGIGAECGANPFRRESSFAYAPRRSIHVHR
jgi:hypothetical protein